jgi:CMP-N-acetylneuraminic acid synthetase
MNITSVIPARLGSSRVKEKALLPFGGEDSLLRWKIKQLINVMPANNIVLSTESAILKDIAINEGIRVHNRDSYLSDGHKASFSEVIYGIISEVEAEHIAWCTFVCPLMVEDDYLQSFQSYNQNVINGSYDSLVGVNEVRDYYWDHKGPLNYKATKEHTISQDLPLWYKVTNSIYMAPKSVVLDKKYILGDNVKVEVLDDMAGIDIDNWFDYQVAVNTYKSISK